MNQALVNAVLPGRFSDAELSSENRQDDVLLGVGQPFFPLLTHEFPPVCPTLASGRVILEGFSGALPGVMSLRSAATVMELVKRRDDEITDANAFFEEEQLQCLEALLPQVEGRTQRQQNPYRSRSVAWAVWVLARLEAG